MPCRSLQFAVPACVEILEEETGEEKKDTNEGRPIEGSFYPRDPVELSARVLQNGPSCLSCY